MTDFETLSASYSSPVPGRSPDLIDVIVGEHAQQLVQTFVELYEPQLRSNTGGLIESLERWSQQEQGLDTAWDVSVGAVHGLVAKQQRHQPPEALAAALGLNLAWHGFADDWNASLTRPARLRFGRWLLPVSDTIAVKADGRRVDILTTCEGRPTKMIFSNGDCETANPQVLRLPVLIRENVACTILCPDSLAMIEAGQLGSKLDAGGEVFSRRCNAALELLRMHAGPYGEWVERLIRYLAPLKVMEDDLMESGSQLYQPGLIYLSNVQDPLQIAETFVHETSHQYLNILGRLVPLCDEADTTLYYSAVKQTGRPINYILLAYHAFANVCLFLRSLGGSGFGRLEDVRNYEARLMGQVRSLEEQLRGAPSVTSCGTALWHDLAHRLETEPSTVGR